MAWRAGLLVAAAEGRCAPLEGPASNALKDIDGKRRVGPDPFVRVSLTIGERGESVGVSIRRQPSGIKSGVGQTDGSS